MKNTPPPATKSTRTRRKNVTRRDLAAGSPQDESPQALLRDEIAM